MKPTNLRKTFLEFNKTINSYWAAVGKGMCDCGCQEPRLQFELADNLDVDISVNGHTSIGSLKNDPEYYDHIYLTTPGHLLNFALGNETISEVMHIYSYTGEIMLNKFPDGIDERTIEIPLTSEEYEKLKEIAGLVLKYIHRVHY